MRQDASMEEWGRLYEAATKLKEKKPWEKFWDMDLIGIQEGDKQDTVFITILGREGVVTASRPTRDTRVLTTTFCWPQPTP